MKKILSTIILLFFIVISVYGQSRDNISLDDAIQYSVLQIQEDLKRGSTIIVYQFKSRDERLSDYILNEIFNLLVNSRNFVILDRANQSVIDAELDFQFYRSAGMISDDSLASLSSRLGASAIITGSLYDTGNEYRFRIRVLGTETSATIVSYAKSINKNDRRISAFSNKPPTVGQKIGTGAMNILFGLGSYLEGDIVGGITITAGYIIAVGLFITEATLLDWDSPAVGVPATIGFTVAGLTIIYGFARPFIYNYSPSMAYLLDNTQTKVILVSDKYTGNYNIGFQLSYNFRF